MASNVINGEAKIPDVSDMATPILTVPKSKAILLPERII